MQSLPQLPGRWLACTFFNFCFMIVKRNFDPVKVWGYIRWPLLFALIWSLLAWIAGSMLGPERLAISFAPVAVLGSALAIFVAFRNNSAYARWWEARQLWGGIVNSSRVLARLVITFSDSHAHQPAFDRARSEHFKRQMVFGILAWVHALRLHLRGQLQEPEARAVLERYLPPEDRALLEPFDNLPHGIHFLMGRKIYEAMANGTLGGFDSFQMEGQLLALANLQGGCERIKNTPLPRQYDYFTRLFIAVFSALLPFGMLSLFGSAAPGAPTWIMVPLSTLLAAVFIIMEKTGAANEDPFENRTTDVPMTALCNTIERDLLQLLRAQRLNNQLPDEKQANEPDSGQQATDELLLPKKLQPENGYLF
jgi:putative membrane protein